MFDETAREDAHELLPETLHADAVEVEVPDMHENAQYERRSAECYDQQGNLRVPVWDKRREKVGQPEAGVRNVNQKRQRGYHEDHQTRVKLPTAT